MNWTKTFAMLLILALSCKTTPYSAQLKSDSSDSSGQTGGADYSYSVDQDSACTVSQPEQGFGLNESFSSEIILNKDAIVYFDTIKMGSKLIAIRHGGEEGLAVGSSFYQSMIFYGFVKKDHLKNRKSNMRTAEKILNAMMDDNNYTETFYGIPLYDENEREVGLLGGTDESAVLNNTNLYTANISASLPPAKADMLPIVKRFAFALGNIKELSGTSVTKFGRNPCTIVSHAGPTAITITAKNPTRIFLRWETDTDRDGNEFSSACTLNPSSKQEILLFPNSVAGESYESNGSQFRNFDFLQLPSSCTNLNPSYALMTGLSLIAEDWEGWPDGFFATVDDTFGPGPSPSLSYFTYPDAVGRWCKLTANGDPFANIRDAMKAGKVVGKVAAGNFVKILSYDKSTKFFAITAKLDSTDTVVGDVSQKPAYIHVSQFASPKPDVAPCVD